jgi:hypothetical protein
MLLRVKAGYLHKLWVLCVVTSYLGLNYVVSLGRWLSFTGTILIIFFSYLAWPNNFKQLLGIPNKLKQYCIIMALLLIIYFSIYYLIEFICLQQNISFQRMSSIGLNHIFFYTLNEEFVLGALLLFSLKNKFTKINPVYISILAAAVFSLPHYIMYRWIFETYAVLSIITLLSLFFIGVLRNNLILKTRHIGYSWALHYCWINIMLGFYFYYNSTHYVLSEVDRFNIFIGNGVTFTIALIFAFISTIWLLSKDVNKLKLFKI